jgi:transcriptional regulator with XRE-family HTH domain
MDIGKKIKILRAERGLSQQDLADLINKTRTLISHIEVTSKVNFYTLTEIANVLNVEISYFTDDYTKNIVNENREDYSNLSNKSEKLERENELLNEIISNQKEIIAQLKEQLKQAKE